MADDIINIGQPAAFEERKEQPYVTDSSKALSKPQLEQQQQSAALTDEAVQATAPKAAYDTDVAKINAADAATKSGILQQTAQLRDQVDTAHAAEIARRADDLRRANDEIKAAPPPSLFADRKGWSKVTGALGLALGGFGDALAARAAARLGVSRGPGAVQQIIEMDLNRQRENIKKLTDVQIMAKEGVKDAQAARDQALAKVDLKGAAMMSAAAAHTEQLLKAKGVELPAIQQNETILGLKRAEQDRKAAAVAGLANEHTRVGPKVETTNRTLPDNASSSKVGVVRKPDGSAAGTSPAGEANEVNDQTRLRVQADADLKELYEDMLKNPRALTADDRKRREELYNKAKIAVGSVSSLGKSDESLKTEMATLGPTGMGIYSGDVTAIKRLIKANEKNAYDAIKIHTAHPGAVGDDGRPPITGAPASPAPTLAPATAAERRPARTPNAPLNAEQQDAMRWLMANPNDPRAPEIRRRLGL